MLNSREKERDDTKDEIKRMYNILKSE